MIKKLKYRFLATIMLFVTIIIIAFVGAVTIIPARENDRQAESFLRMMAETAGAPGDSDFPATASDSDKSILSDSKEQTDGNPQADSKLQADSNPESGVEPAPFPQGNNPDIRPLPKNDKSPYSFANLISAVLDEEGNVLSWYSDRSDLYDEEYIQGAAAELFQSGDEFGKFDGQYYLLLKHDQAENLGKPAETRNEPAGKAGAENNGGNTSEAAATLILLDNSIGFASQRLALLLGAGAGIVVWVILLLLAIFLVNKMTKPVSEAFVKQRRFIADAGHELKTPISVISANAGVLKSEIGESKWLSYINTETHRMELLVKELMSLAAIDDGEKKPEHVDFDLSDSALSAALPFESLAFEKGQTLEFDVAEGVHICGSRSHVEQLVTILLSNAVKYGQAGGLIRLSLSQERKKAILKVYNTGDGISPEDKEKIFDRFYRADKARSREQNSFGLGLAIAKAISDEEGAHISVDSKYGEWVEFRVTFPGAHQS